MGDKGSIKITRFQPKIITKRAAARKGKPVTKSSNDKPAAAAATKLPTYREPHQATSTKDPADTAKTVLLAGGNPQIAKGYGDAPVQAYIAAMPGWKNDTGRRLDALITQTVPGVHKAVKWNSPLYGVEGEGWFLGIHCFTRYIKVAFFRGALLRPVPPGASKSRDTRYLNIYEDDQLDDGQVADWVRQASQLPGEHM